MEWITVREAAKILRVTERTIRKYCYRKVLAYKAVPSNKGRGGKQILILKSSIDNLLRNAKEQDKGTPKEQLNDCNSINYENTKERTKNITISPNSIDNQRDTVKVRNLLTTNANHSRIGVSSEVWISVRTFCELSGLSPRAVQKACRNGKYLCRLVGKRYEILLSSLPIEAQIKYFNQNCNNLSVFSNTFNIVKYNKNNDISPKVDEKALAWVDLLSMYIQYFSGKDKVLQAKREFIEFYNSGKLPEIYNKIGKISFQTIERKRKLYEAGEIERLGDNRGRNRVISRSRKISSYDALIILKNVLKPNKPTIEEAIRAARKELQEQGRELEASDITIRRWINEWKTRNIDFWTLAREGEKKLNDLVSFYIERDYTKIEVGDVVVADGHVLNFEVLNPFTGKPKRMTWIVVYDMKTNMPLGWDIMPTENTQVIASAYRKAILKLGFVPYVFYLDNGKAFRAKYFTGVKDFRQCGIKGLFQKLGTKVIFANPYHAQSKTVERFFRVANEMEKQVPTYVGSGIQNKPARLGRNEKFHRQLYERIAQSTVPTIQEVYLMIDMWMDEYIKRPQRGHLDGKSPLEAYMESLEIVKSRPDYENRRISEEKLAYLMLNEKISTLYRNGIRFLGSYYYADELFSYEKGKSPDGRARFLIKYDFHDLDKILVFDMDENFVCEAYRTIKLHPAAKIAGNDEDKRMLQEVIKYKRHKKKETIKLAKTFLDVTGMIEEEAEKYNRLRLFDDQVDIEVEEEKPKIALFWSDLE